MGHQLFRHVKLRIRGQLNEALPPGGVHPLDLCGLQRKDGMFPHIDLRDRIEHLAAGSIALCVVVLHIGDVCIFSHMKGVDPVMPGLAAAFAVDPAAGHDGDIRPVFYIKIIVYHIHSRLRHDHRNVYLLRLRLSADMDVDPRLVFLLHDPDMPAVPMAYGHSVETQVVRALLLKSTGIDHI